MSSQGLFALQQKHHFERQRTCLYKMFQPSPHMLRVTTCKSEPFHDSRRCQTGVVSSEQLVYDFQPLGPAHVPFTIDL